MTTRTMQGINGRNEWPRKEGIVELNARLKVSWMGKDVEADGLKITMDNCLTK